MTIAAEATANAADAEPVFVYVIGHDGNNVVKIGKADDVGDRLAGIQRMCPVKLHLRTQFDGGYELETALHRHFKHLRSHGEWFDFGDLDPVTEITAAAVEAMARLSAKRELRLERERAIRERGQSWAPAIVDGRLLVFRVNGGTDPGMAQCVALARTRKRCMRTLGDYEDKNPDREWTVPGHGSVDCASHGEGDAEETARWLLQRCRHHADADWPVVGEPEWEVFDPKRHPELLRSDAAPDPNPEPKPIVGDDY